jgi:hypothetical protein
MTTLPISAPPAASAKLRPLSGYEHMFWAFDKINGFNFGIAVAFRGILPHNRWKAAFDQVQNRHPFLSAAIDDTEPYAPHFVRGAGLPIPLVFLRRRSSTDWQRVMETDIAEPFDLSTGPLLRAALLENESGCDLVLTANHIVIDGMGVLALVRELFQVLAGHSLPDLPLPLSADAIVAQGFPASLQQPPVVEAAQPPPPPAAGRGFTSRNRKGKADIRAIRLSPEQTTRLQRYARREQTTVGAVLLAVVESTLRSLKPDLKEAEIHIVTPVDLRPHLGNKGDFVLSIISSRAISPASDRELGATAREFKSQIVPFQSAAAAAAIFGGVEAVLAQKLDATTIVNMVAQGFGHDAMVSNLKTVEFPIQPEGLLVEAVWGPSVLLGVEGEQMIGSATFGGALHLVYSSFTPLSGLLEAVQEKLASACTDG